MEKYRSRADWRARPPEGPLYGWASGHPDSLVAHWIGGGYVNPSMSVAEYDAMARSLQTYALDYDTDDYSDIPYNLGITPTGYVYELRGWNVKSGANGSSTWNSRAFSVCYFAGVSNGKETPLTQAAKAAFVEVWRELAIRFPLKDLALPHSAVRPTYTSCPGDQLRAWISQLPTIGDDDVTPEQLRQELDDYFNGPTGQARLRRAIKDEISSEDANGKANTLFSGTRERVVSTDARTKRIATNVVDIERKLETFEPKLDTIEKFIADLKALQ